MPPLLRSPSAERGLLNTAASLKKRCDSLTRTRTRSPACSRLTTNCSGSSSSTRRRTSSACSRCPAGIRGVGGVRRLRPRECGVARQPAFQRPVPRRTELVLVLVPKPAWDPESCERSNRALSRTSRWCPCFFRAPTVPRLHGKRVQGGAGAAPAYGYADDLVGGLTVRQLSHASGACPPRPIGGKSSLSRVSSSLVSGA